MKYFLFIATAFLSLAVRAADAPVVVGSKAFTEGFVLGEYAAQTLESHGFRVTRRLGLGGTGILFEALAKGEVDVYPEYTGTIAEAILKDPRLQDSKEISAALAERGLVISEPLGFQDGYAVAADARYAADHGLKTIGDLRSVALTARAAFSHEFMTRADGFRGMTDRYKLTFGSGLESIEHSLAFEAIARKQADLIDVYSTDAKIEKYGLKMLADNLSFFPAYKAVFIARKGFVDENPSAWRVLGELAGHFDELKMIRLNSHVDLDKKTPAAVVSEDRGQQSSAPNLATGAWLETGRRTKEHLTLVGFALLFSTLAGVPLGAYAARREGVGQVILLTSGIVQTIPSLALLCFLIPVFGIGLKPALVALCLYGLLPVVLNTFTGIRSIDPRLIEAAEALGLSSWNRLVMIEIPLASASILAGIRTSAVIGIGTATLAALIGAGGYGAPIVTGLAINDMKTILAGAGPAAAMALAAHGFFELLGRGLIPRGLRLSRNR